MDENRMEINDITNYPTVEAYNKRIQMKVDYWNKKALSTKVKCPCGQAELKKVPTSNVGIFVVSGYISPEDDITTYSPKKIKAQCPKCKGTYTLLELPKELLLD